MSKFAPSILSANFDNLIEEIKKIEKGGADYIHCDIMDGKFVENTTFGPEVLEQLEGKTKLPFDVHLMVENPEEEYKKYIFKDTRYISCHLEACKDVKGFIEGVKSKGIKVGLAISPDTPIDGLKQYLGALDMVLVMTVHPGKGGQKLISSTLLKICELDEIRKEKGLPFRIENDGGVTLENCKQIKDAGVDIIVAGSSCFGAEDIEKRCQDFVKLIK